jgi:hypothetical protein
VLPRVLKSLMKPFGIILTSFFGAIWYICLLFLNDFSKNLNLK